MKKVLERLLALTVKESSEPQVPQTTQPRPGMSIRMPTGFTPWATSKSSSDSRPDKSSTPSDERQEGSVTKGKLKEDTAQNALTASLESIHGTVLWHEVMSQVLGLVADIRTGNADSWFIQFEYPEGEVICESVLDVLRQNGLRVEPYKINTAEEKRTVKIWIPGMDTMFEELGNMPKKGTTWN